MRKAYIGVTDEDWFSFLSHRRDLDEVNFWRPSGNKPFKVLKQGELFLFKLHSPNNFIVGGGFFGAFSVLPVSLAWETFGPMNGVASLAQMRARVEHYREAKPIPGEDYNIGNIILEHPFFLTREAWIPVPESFTRNIVQGKSYDLDSGEGLALWESLQLRLIDQPQHIVGETRRREIVAPMFGDPALVKRRLGQGAFRVLVTDNYSRRCAVTGEHTLPVLEAAHIRPVSDGGRHLVDNGLLLRSDVHRLFDKGYVTVTPNYEFRVSKRINELWNNGKVYYSLDGNRIHLPRDNSCVPSREALEWHADTVFLG